MKTKLLTLLLLSVILLTLVSVNVTAVPPFAEEGATSFTEGIFVEYTPLGTFQINDTLQINVHTFNISNGVELDNTTVVCKFSLFNRTQFHVINNVDMNFTINGNDWEYIVLGGNFTTTSDYAYLVDCQDSTNELGGFVAVKFEITATGKPTPDAVLQVVFFAAFLFLIFFMIFSFLRVLGFWKDLSVDILDWAGSISIYMVLFAFTYLAKVYLGDPVINDLLGIMIIVGGVTHVFAATAAFVTSLIFNPLKVKK